jgi:hypothetical protein
MSKTNDIQIFLHCKNCLNKRPANDKKEYIISPREWVHLEVGFTKKGLQIYCVRCEKNVCALDFLGQKVAYDSKWHKPKNIIMMTKKSRKVFSSGGNTQDFKSL